MSSERGFDRKSVAGKVPAPERRVQVLVIGAGTAGVAAAIEAAESGVSVLLVDENPVGDGMMGLDAPLYYGGRYTGAVRAKPRMMEQVFAARPALEQAFEAGVEIALGVYCWGAWLPGEGLVSLPEPLAGLADDERAWMVGFERLVLATGARDVAFAFPGWDQPGVMGAQAFHALASNYDAFAGRRLAILGSGALAERTAELARARGLEVAAVVEVEGAARGVFDGVEVLAGWAPVLGRGGVDGVESLTVRPTAGGADRVIACDTIVQAVSLAPVVELLDVLGPNAHPVTVVGDAANKPADEEIAYRQSWIRALASVSDASLIICQCESVTREALLAVRQPTYLGAPSAGMRARGLVRLLGDGPVSPDQVKRLTRACMGPCQGRRCREQVCLLLADAAGVAPQTVTPLSYRAPVRPLPLSVLAAWDEDSALTRQWDVWFGIATQWAPYGDIGTERETLHAGILGGEGEP